MGQLQICLLISELSLKVCLEYADAEANALFTYFDLSVHPVNSHPDLKIQNTAFRIFYEDPNLPLDLPLHFLIAILPLDIFFRLR